MVHKHSSLQTKPPLVIKLDELCGTICCYYYPTQVGVHNINKLSTRARNTYRSHTSLVNMQIQFFISFIIFSLRGICLADLSALSYWITTTHFYTCQVGVTSFGYACLLEGKRVPTFWCLLRRRIKVSKHVSVYASPGLQFTPTLGKALQLLTKHGLDIQRQKDFPVEVAMESLTSTSTLMVAAAPDMGLTSSIDHFLSNCTTDENHVPIGKMLRAGSVHNLDAYDIPELLEVVNKCLKWARDPDRPSIANTTIDEAAAIQLYTQQSCLYPRLNSALRDHVHAEKLKPFLPYLKLLLKGLNKLPLVRTRVYRGVSVDLHNEYNQLLGKVFTWWAFSSTTMDAKLMEGAAFLGNKGEDRTLFNIDAIGIDIAAFSAFPNEMEVLLLPGTSLTMEAAVEVEPNFWKFEASVWKAAQQEEDTERAVESSKPTSVSSVECVNALPELRFQNVDLPHPGWEDYKNDSSKLMNNSRM